MARISKRYTFEAAHFIPDHPGKCKRMHGHSYKIEVDVWGRVQAKTGMVIDFDDLDKAVKPIIKMFDHQILNDFMNIPTAENIARYVLTRTLGNFFLMKLGHDELHNTISFTVRVWETEKCFAEVDGSDLS